MAAESSFCKDSHGIKRRWLALNYIIWTFQKIISKPDMVICKSRFKSESKCVNISRSRFSISQSFISLWNRLSSSQLTGCFLTAAPQDLSGQMRLNGALDGQPVVKKRRGRRKNVEGMDLLFMNRSRVPAVPDQVSTYLLILAKAGLIYNELYCK